MTASFPLPRADLVLPCLDEAEALPWVLGRVPAGWRAIVVDNGSTDGSDRIARSLGATVVYEPRRGFGSACHAGLLAAEAEYVCFCDCDASLDPALLDPFVRLLAQGRADLVLGRRRARGRGAWPAHARAGNLALARMLRRRTGLALRDLGPLRAARRAELLGLGLTDRRSGYPLEMVVRAADEGWRVAEHDVPYLPRSGKSKVTGTWRGTWQAVRDMRGVLAAPPRPGTAPARDRDRERFDDDRERFGDQDRLDEGDRIDGRERRPEEREPREASRARGEVRGR
ncbi:glycosyltransferase [Streptomyces albus]|uniref:Glycosyltransferase n=1 Tax=Streptomyces albus (strain ATCC 21838 / DSM 41398 / FERM P-419 / JCM 4703 / NBRC 107858) TaxID=1081613 RepID=A0A0B5EMY0_STRA4|nr:glycosyltransferase [Streptomyces albus]AOU78187.1 glycosyltransferase [Streptomyces albus]AYN33941.1 glycosyltransferase [Streptomyces albus]